jgi:4-amino-4-deoxy-L-arabinose transferase-like glycosyltransferase
VTEREWREAIDMRSSAVSLGLVLLVAAGLRLWDVREAAISTRELIVLDPVVQLMHAGTYRPATIAWPALPVYVYTAVSVAHFIWGALIGAWHNAAGFAAAQVVGWGRGFSAILGIAVVVLVYQIGMRWGARHALLAAGLMAVMPTHVVASREIGDGALVTFFTTLTLLLSLVGIERPRRATFATAGVTAGLAAASAYPAALVLLVPLTAAWMTRSDEGPRGWRAVAAIAGAVVAFVLVTPRVVTDLPAFLNGAGAAATPAPLGVMNRVQLAGQLLTALQWPGLILAVAGLVLGIVRAIGGPGHTRWTVLVSFPVIYFIVVGSHGATSDQILLPILPMMVVLAANAVIVGVGLLRRFDIPRAARTALIAALTVAAVLPPAIVSIQLVLESRAGRDR